MDIQKFWRNDTDINKPKLMKKGGSYTKKFIQYIF